MAKSLRSKSKLQAKSLKRKGEFQNFVDERNKRIAEKLQKETAEQEVKKKKAKEDKQDGGSMDVDQPKKVSTSGWRDSNSQRYKQSKLKNKVKKKTMKF
ncbi:uncharacterized protein LODBEIA_P35540 [Lodderomyces beijingensis]|uniref:DUF2423 domain-containing protein n=1 Tax=Lodderomyces beijingensis TaxID=1775926 RepID=A0ABP0ZSZ2_9ASCO